MSIIQAGENHFMDVMFLLRRCVEDWNTSCRSAGVILEDIIAGNLFISLELSL